MRNFAELQYQTSAHEALRIINKWSKKSENKELEELSKHIIQMVSYTAGLHVERRGYENSVENMRNELIKAINKNNEYTN